MIHFWRNLINEVLFRVDLTIMEILKLAYILPHFLFKVRNVFKPLYLLKTINNYIIIIVATI